MAEQSKIEWCDHTFNPWEGCTKVSPGCARCYAESRNARWNKGTAVHWGKGAPRRRTSGANWKKPIKWNKKAGAEELAAQAILSDPNSGHANRQWAETWHRPRVFCASLADWLDAEVPVEWLTDLLDLIRQTPYLDWLLLTKRPENWKPRLEAALAFYADRIESALTDDEADFMNWLSAWIRNDGIDPIPPNIWIGTTAEDQKRADERIPKLLQIPATVRFLSCEPLLEDVRIFVPLNVRPKNESLSMMGGIHWVICGGESGAHARPMHPEWALSLRDQCAAAHVPFFFKQWGDWLPICYDPPGWQPTPDGQDWHKGKPSIVLQRDGRIENAFPEGAMTCIRIGKKSAGRLLCGNLHHEFPS